MQHTKHHYLRFITASLGICCIILLSPLRALPAEEEYPGQGKDQLVDALDAAIARVKDSELAVLVAELNYDKAKIARQYQDKKLKEQGKAKEEPSFFSKIFGGSGDDGIDLEEYKSYFDVTRNRLKTDQENQKILENRMIQAEKDYNSFVVDDAGIK